MYISEPITTLTDYALGAANLLFSFSIFAKINQKNKVSGLLLGLGFFAGASSAFAGGTYHGLATHLEERSIRHLWNVTMFSIGAMLAFLCSGVHAADVCREHGRWILAGAAVTVIGLAIQVSGFRSHQNWNHNDVFHVVQIAAMALFFKGVRNLQDRAYSPK
jgi:hypothetical protein